MKQMFINGEWTDALNGKTREIINPYNQEVIEVVAEGNEEDTKQAIKAAREALTMVTGNLRLLRKEARRYFILLS